MPTYIVGVSDSQFGEQDFMIAAAPDSDAAVALYIFKAAQETGFREYVGQRTVNMSFAEQFWLDEGRDEDDSLKVVENDEFRRRVYRFFGSDHQDWAEAFILGWDADDNAEQIPVQFPPEMLAFMWINSEWADVVAFSVEHPQ